MRDRKPFFEVRSSPIHGLGAFSVRSIRKGTRIIEYVGERLSSSEVDARYDEDDPARRQHTCLFSVDDDTCVDASSGGNESQFINHSCDPNCESEIDAGRVFIKAIKNIPLGMASVDTQNRPMIDS